MMTGAALATLIERMVTALNSREIPSAGSMLEFFNKEVRGAAHHALLIRCVAQTSDYEGRATHISFDMQTTSLRVESMPSCAASVLCIQLTLRS